MKKEKSKTYQSMADELRRRLDGRNYVIGIDPGVGSIGISAIALDHDEEGREYASDIVYACSRIFIASDGAAERYAFRNMRNIRRHSRNRLFSLWGILAEKGLMLMRSEQKQAARFSSVMDKADPYELRLKGLTSALTLEELGVVIYHIASHRGSKTIRIANDDGAAEDNTKIFESTKRICSESGVDTFIEVLDIFNKDSFVGYRNKVGRSLTDRIMPVPTRNLIENEFDRIMSTQKTRHPDILTDEYISRIRETVFFENLKISTVPGNCPYFPEEKRLPKASFLNEERRLREAVNNIRIVRAEQPCSDRKALRESLSQEEKEVLFAYLREGNTLTHSSMKALLPCYGKATLIFPGTNRKEQKIVGFRFRELEEKPFFKALNEQGKDHFIRLFINTADDRLLRKYLEEDFCLEEEDVDWVLNSLVLIGDYAPVGRSAMEILMKKITEESITYRKAENDAVREGLLPDPADCTVYDLLPYYGEALPFCTKPIDGKARHPLYADKVGKKGFFKPSCDREEDKFGRIPNPVVHQTLNQMRKLVNEVIEIFGRKPVRFVVEVGKELKVGKAKRNLMTMENAIRNKSNQQLYDRYCVPNHLDRKYVKIFRLLELQNWICPYSLRKMTVADVVNGNYDIDHIFPRLESEDSSDENCVICDRYTNQVVKGQNIPFEAFSGDEARWEKILDYLEKTPGMQSKKWRFLITWEEYRHYLESNLFSARFKTDNAYVSKIICRYLCSLYPAACRLNAVMIVRGAETSMLRRAWNLNGITQKLRIIHSSKVKTDDIFTKDRTDARHHALDAIVLGYCTREVLNDIKRKYKNRLSSEVMAKRLPVPEKYSMRENMTDDEKRSAFRAEIEDFIINKAYVSRKMDTDKNGKILMETRLTVFAASDSTVLLKTSKLVKNIKARTFFGNTGTAVEHAFSIRIPEWLSEEEKDRIHNSVKHNEEAFKRVLACREKAENALEIENHKRAAEGKKLLVIDESKIVSKALAMAGGKYDSFISRMNDKVHIMKSGNSVFAQDTGENYSLDLYYDDQGIMRGEIIRKVNANKKGWIPDYVKNGYSLVERLHGRDILEVDMSTCEEPKTNREVICGIRANNAPSGKTFICLKCFTEHDNGIVNFHFDSVNASRLNDNATVSLPVLCKIGFRKVVISTAGLISYRSSLFKSE